MARHALCLAAILIAAPGVPGAAQTSEVTARGETAPVGTANADAADDPAIWRNARQPSKSLIVATDKKAGLYVYGLDGAVKHFAPAGRLNNVDLIDLGLDGIIVAASDRNNEKAASIQLYRLDPVTAKKKKFNIEKVWGCAKGSGLQFIKPEDRIFKERPLLWDDPEWRAQYMPGG